MIPKKYNEDDFIDSLTNPISDIMAETQYNILAVITNRINTIGKLSATDAHQLSQLVRMEDLQTIESIIAAGSNLSVKEIDSIVEQAAQNNDDLAEYLYKYRNMPPSTFLTDTSLLNAVTVAKKSIKNEIVKLSDTRAMNLVINGKATPIEKAYNYAVNRAVFEVQQGLFDYNTAMRSTITELAQNGLGVIEYESGYRRRLDSSVNMNISDGIRKLNTEYRTVQGTQFGSDGIELSAHALSSPDHLPYQGKQYSNEEFANIQASLKRPFFQYNCKHSIHHIILGVSDPVYSDKELQQYKDNSEKEVTYTTRQKDKNGNYIKKTLHKYDSSQVQRRIETSIRQMKDQRNQLSLSGDNIGVSELDKKIKARTKYYKSVSEEIGLTPKMEKLRVYGPK